VAQCNRVLHIWKVHFEQRCLAARTILCKSANYTDMAIAFELADLSSECFARYPEWYLVEREPAGQLEEVAINGGEA
jgi:hypothetical protein